MKRDINLSVIQTVKGLEVALQECKVLQTKGIALNDNVAHLNMEYYNRFW